MAPTEGRFAMPERRWGCRRGTPTLSWNLVLKISSLGLELYEKKHLA